jgi:ABC-2 type transport system permease protein
MIRILDLALKDLRQIGRDRKVFIFLLVMPILFTLLFGFAFGGNQTDDPRLPVGLLNEDEGAMGQRLVELLQNSAVIRLDMETTDAADLQEQVDEGNLVAAVLIPADYSQAGLITFLAHPGSSTAFSAQSEVETAAFRLDSAQQTAELSLATAVEQGLLSGEAERAAYYQDAFGRALDAWQTPPVTVAAAPAVALAADDEPDTSYSVYAHSSPGMIAQFAVAGLMGASTILVLEKKNRCLQRLLTTNLSRAHILLGHFLAMCTMIFLQLVTLVLFGQLVLGLPYLSQPLATLLVTLATTLFCASLGLVIGAIARNEDQAIIFALVPMFILSGLGGAWMPLEFTPAIFQRIAYVTPLAWVIDGYKDIIVRGLGVEAVLAAVAVLLAYTIGLFALAVWRFRFD